MREPGGSCLLMSSRGASGAAFPTKPAKGSTTKEVPITINKSLVGMARVSQNVFSLGVHDPPPKKRSTLKKRATSKWWTPFWLVFEGELEGNQPFWGDFAPLSASIAAGKRKRLHETKDDAGETGHANHPPPHFETTPELKQSPSTAPQNIYLHTEKPQLRMLLPVLIRFIAPGVAFISRNAAKHRHCLAAGFEQRSSPDESWQSPLENRSMKKTSCMAGFPLPATNRFMQLLRG